MSQFLGFAIFLIIATGLALHAGVELPWFMDWIGKLPGDLIIKKGTLTLYLPIASCVLVSIALSAFFSLFSKK